MPRRIFAIALPLFLALVVKAAPPAAPDVPTLIANLGDADPDVRRAAARQLTDLGSSVRPALMQAMDASAPEVRTQLSQILLRRPWVGPRDSPEVQQCLTDYGQLGADERCQRVHSLTGIQGGGGQEALIRILQYDPSAAVRWQSADDLRLLFGQDNGGAQRLRDLPVDEQTTNAPLLAAVGWAWRESDAARTNKLLTQAIAADAAHPAAMSGQLDFAYNWLVHRALEAQKYAAAADLLRQQSAAAGWNADTTPPPIAALFALHAQYGPFAGFAADLHAYRAYLGQPELLYSLSHIMQQMGTNPLSPGLTLCALCAGGISPERHLQSAAFLADQGWFDPAERECHLALLLCSSDSTEEIVNIYFQLARIAGERDDELATAKNLESALLHMSGDSQLRRSTSLGEELPWSVPDAWAEVHWHYLRAAQASNDLPAMQLHLQKLLELDKLGQVLHEDPGLASDIVPALQQTGRTAEAEKYFNSAYKDLNDELAAHPSDAEAKNNLAWLCARCDRRLPEAVKLADEAVAAQPDNSAYLDTAAECHFRAGDKQLAVTLETRAVGLKPHDAFLLGQVQRFRGESPHVSPHP